MSKYRELCYDIQHIRALNATASINDTVLSICLAASDPMTTEQYHNWLSHWKSAYSQISAMIGAIKYDVVDVEQNERQIAVNSLRRLANTMLNARQYARDHYRGLKNQ